MSFTYMPAALRTDNNLLNIARWVNYQVENTLDAVSLVLDGKKVPERAVYVGGYSFVHGKNEFGEDLGPAFDLANWCLNSNAPDRKVIGVWNGEVEVSGILTPSEGEDLTEFAYRALHEGELRDQTDVFITNGRYKDGGAVFPAQTTEGTIKAVVEYLSK